MFGHNISFPYFRNFSHLKLPDNIGRIRRLHLILFQSCTLCFNRAKYFRISAVVLELRMLIFFRSEKKSVTESAIRLSGRMWVVFVCDLDDQEHWYKSDICRTFEAKMVAIYGGGGAGWTTAYND